MRISAVIFFVLVIALPLSAQGPRGRISIPDRVKMLTDQLSLSKAQADSVQSILEAAQKERADIFQAHQDDRTAMRSLMQKQAQTVDEKIQALLTADQKKSYEKVKKDRPGLLGPPRRVPKPNND